MATSASSKPPATSSSTAPASNVQDGYVRLHITPFDKELLSVVLSSAVLPNALNISYHTLATFPDKRYGFVDLPVTDAEKLKKKLNGTVLRGTKMRVDTARPEKVREPADTAEDEPTKAKESTKEKKSKKRKRDLDVTEGVELNDRKIKRGWTVSEQDMIKGKREKRTRDRKDKKDKQDKKDKKKQNREVKSKFTDAPECLFKQKMPEKPATKRPLGEENDDDDDVEITVKKKKRKGDRSVVIHEFERTVKHPSFLRSTVNTSQSKALTFEEGKGWVDEGGNVVEAARNSTRPQAAPKLVSAMKKTKAPEPEPEPMEEEEDEDMDENVEEEEQEQDDDTSSSGTSSDEDEDEDDESKDAQSSTQTPKKLALDTSSIPTISLSKADSARPKSSAGSATSLTIKIPPVTPAKVHPLEALYKRRQNTNGPDEAGGGAEVKPFSFFGNEDNEEEVEDKPVAAMRPPSMAPMTPFTQQDFDFRNVRSAAPTPDTAHPSRAFNFWPGGDDELDKVDEEEEKGDDDDNEEEDQEVEDEEAADEAQEDGATDEIAMPDAAPPTSDPAAARAEPLSDFQRHFWENRGEMNRSWKRRRKVASKEKRNRENRARAARAI